MRLCLFICGLLLIVFSQVTALWAMSCSSTKPRVGVTLAFKRAIPAINNRVSQRRLARKSGQRGYHAQTIGLTESGLFAKVFTTFTLQSSNRSKKTCVTPESIRLEYGFGKTPVLIDRRYRPGSCEYRAVLAHEMAHIQIMNDKSRGYSSWVRRKITQKVGTVKPVLTKRPRRVQKKMAAQMKKMAASLINRISKSLAVAHQVIDTPESYRRTQSQCSNW
jgi:hypothetical protein